MDIGAAQDAWLDDPTLFVEKILGVTPDPWQQQVMEAVARGDRGVSIRSGHGVGKTACLSWMVRPKTHPFCLIYQTHLVSASP